MQVLQVRERKREGRPLEPSSRVVPHCGRVSARSCMAAGALDRRTPRRSFAQWHTRYHFILRQHSRLDFFDVVPRNIVISVLFFCLSSSEATNCPIVNSRRSDIFNYRTTFVGFVFLFAVIDDKVNFTKKSLWIEENWHQCTTFAPGFSNWSCAVVKLYICRPV